MVELINMNGIEFSGVFMNKSITLETVELIREAFHLVRVFSNITRLLLKWQLIFYSFSSLLLFTKYLSETRLGYRNQKW